VLGLLSLLAELATLISALFRSAESRKVTTFLFSDALALLLPVLACLLAYLKTATQAPWPSLGSTDDDKASASIDAKRMLRKAADTLPLK